MEEKKKLMSFKDFLSGSIAGIVQVLLGQPFDIVKVRMQTQGDAYKSPIDCAKSILKNEGLTGFYKGTLSPLIGISFCVAIQFGSNEIAKNYFANRNKKLKNNSSLEIKDYILCGMFAGACNSIVISPVELFRIQMQVQTKALDGAPAKYSGTADCARKIYSQFGMRGVYQGYSSTLFREVPAYAVYFGLYETLMGKSEKTHGSRKDIPIYKVMTYGALSGVFLWLSTFPHDVIKSCIQADDPNNRKFKSIISTTKIIYQNKGIGGFFKGLSPCLMRAPPINAATFLTFEMVQKFLNRLEKNN